jgi:hypothetical protein
MFCSCKSLQFYRLCATIFQYFGASQTLCALLAIDSGISKSHVQDRLFWYFHSFPLLKFLTLMFDSSVLHVAEVVAETFSGI